MPFDRLPSYNLNIPEFRPHVAPAPPVSQVPSAIAEAVAKILGQVMETTNPTARKKKKLENAKLDQQLNFLQNAPYGRDPATGESITEAQSLNLQYKRNAIRRQEEEVKKKKSGQSAFDMLDTLGTNIDPSTLPEIP